MKIYRITKNASKRELIFLIGPPAIGKSTWIKNNKPDAFVINRDDVVEKVCSSFGLNYDDMFATPPQELPIGHVDPKFGKVIPKPTHFPPVIPGEPPQPVPKFLPNKLWENVFNANVENTKQFYAIFEQAHQSGKDIIMDLTNLNPDDRKRNMKMLGDKAKDYSIKAINFNFQGEDVRQSIKDIARQRAMEIKEKGGSKTIPDEAFDRMYGAYGPPTPEEGFEEITEVDERERLLEMGRKIREQSK